MQLILPEIINFPCNKKGNIDNQNARKPQSNTYRCWLVKNTIIISHHNISFWKKKYFPVLVNLQEASIIDKCIKEESTINLSFIMSKNPSIICQGSKIIFHHTKFVWSILTYCWSYRSCYSLNSWQARDWVEPQALSSVNNQIWKNLMKEILNLNQQQNK